MWWDGVESRSGAGRASFPRVMARRGGAWLETFKFVTYVAVPFGMVYVIAQPETMKRLIERVELLFFVASLTNTLSIDEICGISS